MSASCRPPCWCRPRRPLRRYRRGAHRSTQGRQCADLRARPRCATSNAIRQSRAACMFTTEPQRQRSPSSRKPRHRGRHAASMRTAPPTSHMLGRRRERWRRHDAARGSSSTKSTVPVGTGEKVRGVVAAALAEARGKRHHVRGRLQPQFSEGRRRGRRFHASPTASSSAPTTQRRREKLRELYAPFSRNRRTS